jgi:hypothetical protein
MKKLAFFLFLLSSPALAQQPLPRSVTGTMTNSGDTLVINTVGMTTMTAQLNSSPGESWAFEGAVDGTNFYAMLPFEWKQTGAANNDRIFATGQFAMDPAWPTNVTIQLNVAGMQQARIRKTAGTTPKNWTLSTGPGPERQGSFVNIGIPNEVPLRTNGGGALLVAEERNLTIQGYASTPTFNLGTLNGAATDANQTTGNTSLATIATRTPALGQATMVNSSPVVIASNQSAVNVTDQHTNVTADYHDAGTQFVTMYGIALPSLFGAQPGGTATNPIRVDPTGTTTQTVSGTVGISGTVTDQHTNLTADFDTSGATTNVTMFGIAVPSPIGPLAAGGTLNPLIVSAQQSTPGTAPWLTTLGDGFQTAAFATSAPVGTEVGLVTRPIGTATEETLSGFVATAGSDSATAVSVQGAVGGNPVPITATTLPLATGASTSANQTTGNTSLSSIDTKTPALGQTTMTGSRPVVIASNQSAVPVSGTVTANVGTGNAVVSTVNSSTAALGIGAVFTGTSEDVTEYVDARVLVFSNQASATDGLSIQQSSDGTNWDIVDAYSIPASTGKTFGVGTVARFFRVVYTNGGTAQATFRLATIFHKRTVKASSVRPQDARPNDNDMEETLAYLAAFNGTTWDRVRIANGGLATTNVESTRTAGTLTSATCPGTGCVSVTTTNYAMASVTINGTYSVTPVFEFSDDGTNFYSVTCTRTDSAVQESSAGALVNTLRAWDCSVFGTTSFRVRASAFVSGTANIGIILSGTPIEAAPTVALTTGSAVNAQINGVNQSVQQGVADTGTARVVFSQEATYSAGTTLKTATAAGTGPFFSLCGSATKTIRVQRIAISGTVATAAVWGDVILKTTSTATSGGTATALTAAPYDTSATAATATANYYTVLATTPGTMRAVVLNVTQLFPVTAISATLQPTPVPIIYVWRDQDAEAPTLRGTAQCLTANFGTTTTNAPTLSVSVAWTEK